MASVAYQFYNQLKAGDTLKLFEGVDVFTFIAGRGITEAENPAAAAREFKDEIKRIWG